MKNIKEIFDLIKRAVDVGFKAGFISGYNTAVMGDAQEEIDEDDLRFLEVNEAIDRATKRVKKDLKI